MPSWPYHGGTPSNSRRRKIELRTVVFGLIATFLVLLLVLGDRSTSWTTRQFEKLSSHHTSTHSAPSDSPRCPTSASPVYPVDRPLHTGQQNCHDVPSSDTAFRLEVCWAPYTCHEFSVRIHRLDQEACAAYERLAHQRSHDPALVKMLQGSGPDLFMIRTNGAQRYASVDSIYEGNCTYRFNVSLSSAGPVWLDIWLVYEASRTSTYDRDVRDADLSRRSTTKTMCLHLGHLHHSAPSYRRLGCLPARCHAPRPSRHA